MNERFVSRKEGGELSKGSEPTRARACGHLRGLFKKIQPATLAPAASPATDQTYRSFRPLNVKRGH